MTLKEIYDSLSKEYNVPASRYTMQELLKYTIKEHAEEGIPSNRYIKIDNLTVKDNILNKYYRLDTKYSFLEEQDSYGNYVSSMDGPIVYSEVHTILYGKDKKIETRQDTTVNNGGKTSYYNLPQPSVGKLNAIIACRTVKPLSDISNEIKELFPQTLNDLIEYKQFSPWQHEVFKACYALKERANKATDGSSSELREINKIIYYALRGRRLLTNKD
jgi:hypothetical protein